MYRIFSLYKESFSNIEKNIWILSIATFINRSGAMVLLFTSLYLTKELDFTIGEAGLIMGFYGAGSVLGAFTGGWLADRKNFVKVMLFSLFASGFVLLFLPFAKSQMMVSAIVFIYAFTSDIFRPANSKAIAIYSKSNNRTRLVSLTRLAINLGFSIGPAVGGFVAVQLGYKWLFVIDACTSFLAGIMLYYYLPINTENTPIDTTTDRPLKSPSAYKDIVYLFFIFLVALYGICFFQLFASMPQYFDKVCNYNEDTIGLLLGLNGLLVVIIEMPLILVLEKYKEAFRFIIMGAACIPISFAIIKFGNCLMLWVIVYTLIITFSEMFAMPFMFNYALSRGKKDRHGEYSALYSIAYGLANTFAPMLGLGIAYKYGFEQMLYFIIALGTITTLGFMILKTFNKNYEK